MLIFSYLKCNFRKFLAGAPVQIFFFLNYLIITHSSVQETSIPDSTTNIIMVVNESLSMRNWAFHESSRAGTKSCGETHQQLCTALSLSSRPCVSQTGRKVATAAAWAFIMSEKLKTGQAQHMDNFHPGYSIPFRYLSLG